MMRKAVAVLAAIVIGCLLLPAAAAAAPAQAAAAINFDCTLARWDRSEDFLWRFLPNNSAAYPNDLDCWLREGDYNNFGVVALQDMLVKCYGQAIAVDGDFGPRTREALAIAQWWEHTVNDQWQVRVSGVYSWNESGAYLRWPHYRDRDDLDRYYCWYLKTK
ncbi:peptidoglycan-binding domain-containing protein [Phytohabitans rumicis]|uniref:Peptidoglycan binding-like domain-containing protein n=1 Tax=Phytohabitans rumicis TaxID=1076125 RepID=A0A6V8LG23_9ACTN|nr:peptidoglycan-binding domain-containing protein [Phytohabitans rumicis]GFJ93771.1 hypothetical protein Prum_074130 [Phytohabitans rumicis]